MAKSVKEHCTQKVIATCTKLRQCYEDGHRSRYPVYEFDYNGQHYKVSKEQNIFKTQPGTEHEIYINPNNPEEYYHPLADAAEKRAGILGAILFGIVFLVLGYSFLVSS